MGISDIQFVIVLYNQDFYSSITYSSLLKNLKEYDEKISLFIYDNSPTAQILDRNEDTVRLEYFHDPSNSGLSKAYNLAAKIGERNNKTWLILLDQDTFFPEKSMSVYLDAIKEHPEVKLFAPILRISNGLYMSPCRYHYKWGKLISEVNSGLVQFDKLVPVNSGLCVQILAFNEVGGYNENVKVDGADFQFIERFKKKYNRFYILDLILEQDFSMFEEDFNKIISRYSIFLKDVKNFERHYWYDRLYYFRIICIRTLKLSLQTRNLKVIDVFFKSFFNG